MWGKTCAWLELALSKYLWIKKWMNNWGVKLEALRNEYLWWAENTDWKVLIFTVSSVFFSYLPVYPTFSTHVQVVLHGCLCTHENTCTHIEMQFRVWKGSDSTLPSVLQVIYCINQPASGKCMGSDYTIIYNTISMKHLSRPIHQSLIQ